MKFALSTNWCNRRLESGEAIVDAALALGFDGLELGFHTTSEQVAGFRRRLGEMPVGSVHAFCPVPLSAPCGYPELYSLAAPDEDAYRLACVHVTRNIVFAASMGATALVLHAGRVPCAAWFARNRVPKRLKRGRKVLESFKTRIAALVPELERNNVRLGLENLPYLEGFPNEAEIADVVGPWVRPWLDTGHDYVREQNGWKATPPASENPDLLPLGLHLNDSAGGDDHLPPGEGKVDFAALAPVALKAEHLVFEPHDGVTEDALRAGLAHLKNLWK